MTDCRTCNQDTVARTASTGGVKPVARLAWLIVAYNIAVNLWGAYVRAPGSGVSCGSRWPLPASSSPSRATGYPLRNGCLWRYLRHLRHCAI